MSNRITHFEIHAADPQRAAGFYKHVFGWDFPQMMETPPYWGVMTAAPESSAPGINGGMLNRRGPDPEDGAPVNAFVCTVEVEDLDTVHALVVEAGGTVALAKQGIPGVGWQAYYKDTEGNIFGVHQPDEDAA